MSAGKQTSGGDVVMHRGWVMVVGVLVLLQSLILLFLAFRDSQPCICGIVHNSLEAVSDHALPISRGAASLLEIPSGSSQVEIRAGAKPQQADKWTEWCYLGGILDDAAREKLRKNPPESGPVLPYAYGMKKSVLPDGFKPFAEILCRSKSDKQSHKYGHMYSQYLDPLRLQQDEVNMLEIGLRQGDSLNVWVAAFPHGKIYGLDAFYTDVKEHLKKEYGERVEIFRGDQEDPQVLTRIVEKIKGEVGMLDFVVDDGGHTMGQQLASFQYLFPLVRPGGLYFIEDLQTSYWAKKCHHYNNGEPYCYGGGPPGAKNTTIDLLKSLIDTMNADFVEDHKDIGKLGSGVYSVHPLDRLVGSVHCWRNMCAVRRKFEGSEY